MMVNQTMATENKVIEEQLWHLANTARGEIKSREFQALVINLLAWGVLSQKGRLPAGVMSTEEVLAHGDLKAALTSVWDAFQQQKDPQYHAFDLNTETIRKGVPVASLLKLVLDVIEKEQVGALVDAALKMTDGRTEPFIVAPSLSAFLTLLLKKNQVKEIYAPFTHSANLIKDVMQNVEHLYIENMDHGMCNMYTLLAFICNAEAQVAQGNALYAPHYRKSPIALRQFENTVSIPPFGVKRSRDDIARMQDAAVDVFNRFQGEHNLRGEAPYFLHIAAQTTGKAFVVTLPGTLFRRNEQSLRQEWVDTGVLRAVVSLPSKLFSHTALASVLLVFDYAQQEADGVYFIDASSEQFTESHRNHNALIHVEELADRVCKQREVAHEAVKVSAEALRAQDYDLQPQRYILSEEEEKMMKTINTGTFVALGDAVEIISTRSLKDAEKGQVFAEIRSSAIPEAGFIALENLDDDDVKSRSLDAANAKAAEKQVLAPYDVLLSVKGRVGEVGIMPGEVDSTYIAGQAYCILRSKNEAEAVGLYMFLQSEFGQQQLQKLTSGATIAQITPKTLKEMQVPAFDAEQLAKARSQFEEEIELMEGIEKLKLKMKKIRAEFLNHLR